MNKYSKLFFVMILFMGIATTSVGCHSEYRSYLGNTDTLNELIEEKTQGLRKDTLYTSGEQREAIEYRTANDRLIVRIDLDLRTGRATHATIWHDNGNIHIQADFWHGTDLVKGTRGVREVHIHREDGTLRFHGVARDDQEDEETYFTCDGITVSRDQSPETCT